jgi:2-polyprenyl-3-methyl-5-hydroxy-6-metoxy-1,4-benzoquinol methylase
MDQSRQWPTCLREVPNHHLNRYLFAEINSVGRTLDAACGAGYGTSLLASRTASVFGVDQSEEAIRWAAVFFPGPVYRVGKIEERPWVGKFDTVISLETIEHLKDPSGALDAFREACLGSFIVSVPNEERYPFKAENFANDESPHFRHYTPSEFDELLVKHGFKVKSRHSQTSKMDSKVNEGADGMFMIYVCE